MYYTQPVFYVLGRHEKIKARTFILETAHKCLVTCSSRNIITNSRYIPFHRNIWSFIFFYFRTNQVTMRVVIVDCVSSRKLTINKFYCQINCLVYYVFLKNWKKSLILFLTGRRRWTRHLFNLVITRLDLQDFHLTSKKIWHRLPKRNKALLIQFILRQTKLPT